MDSPLGRLRKRALAARTSSARAPCWRQAATASCGSSGRWHEHASPRTSRSSPRQPAAHRRRAARAAPARLRDRVAAIPLLPVGRRSARWLPPGAWQACRARLRRRARRAADPGRRRRRIGRSATAVVGCVADEHGVRVALVEVWQGADARAEGLAPTSASSSRPDADQRGRLRPDALRFGGPAAWSATTG